MRTLFWSFCFSLLPFFTFAQVIPPGLGKTKMAGWLAVGIQQDLDTAENTKWQSVTYLGVARKSDPDNYNLFAKPAAFILNQEFKNNFSENWQYSLALSYRRQNEYSDTAPYDEMDPPLRQEFRMYGRISYEFKTLIVSITPTLRQEFRKFYAPDFESFPENFQVRSRFRLKFSFPISLDKTHRILAFSEQLFSSSQDSNPKEWSRFKYKDSRFALYYALSPKEMPFNFNLGYMNNIIASQPSFSGNYIALDVIWKNPFTSTE